MKRKKSRLNRNMTHTNEEFFNPQFYSVHEEHDFNYNLVPNPNEEVMLSFHTKLKT